jgi:C-terminal processing protease CtpA/Prc
MSAFNEAHLGLTTNSLLWNDYFKNGKEFPFSIFDYTDKTLIVNDDLSGKARLQMFDRIISINNIPVSVLIDKYERLFGGLSSWRKYQFSNMFSFLLYADKIYPPFTIQAKSKGKMISFTTEGSPQKKEKEVENQNFTLNISDSIAYLNFFTMTGSLQTFNDSLKLAFSTLKRQKIKYLIVDLRNNNGGDSRMGDILLSYFNTKPYRMTSSGHLLVSSAFKKANLHFLPLYKKIAILLIPNGVLINLKQYEIIPYASEPFFDGKVCVLIGKGTFSSANMLANAIKDYNLAYLIGETTAESANDYGDMISFMLPNTQLIGRVPCKKFTRANGDVNNNEGIFPDLEVIPLPSQQFAGEDVVKQAAINWLKDNYEIPVIY